MFQAERYNVILDILNRKKSVSIDKLCKETFCSPATIRRDLISLEKSGLISRNRGGASIIMSSSMEYPYAFRNSKKQIEKDYICNIAENFVSDGSSLFLDSSSTVLQICKLIEKRRNISVVTNGLATAFSLAQSENVKVCIAGGHIKTGSAAIIGEFSSGFIKNFKADVAIISCRGVDEDGIYEADQDQALVKQQMIKNAKLTILLCDNSKFGSSYFYKLCDFFEIEALITDKKPSTVIEQRLLSSGCEILY
ncbi:MAG: DeoR/GlpR family DNA-binding transcription regulator [Oscillospiraceae bacterium]